MSKHRLQPVGEPADAFYNPPCTLPVFRRTEITFDITSSASGIE